MLLVMACFLEQPLETVAMDCRCYSKRASNQLFFYEAGLKRLKIIAADKVKGTNAAMP